VILVRAPYDLSYFSDAELATADGFKLPKRREEWLLARYAAKRLALQRGITGDPRACSVARPMLLVDGAPVNWFVSISHSGPYAAAAVEREPVGVDIEVVRTLSEGTAHLFLSEEETEAMFGCTLEHRALHFWCAKEAAWKRRSEEFATLKQLPLTLVAQGENGLLFDAVETRVEGDVVVALTRPTA
jgi:phosphopantetheinyl transferase